MQLSRTVLFRLCAQCENCKRLLSPMATTLVDAPNLIAARQHNARNYTVFQRMHNWRMNDEPNTQKSAFVGLFMLGCLGVFAYYFERTNAKSLLMIIEAGGAVRNESEIVESEQEDDADNDSKTKAKEKKRRIGFRERKIIAYEDRIRQYSTPDKIFRYFATLKVYPANEPRTATNFEVFMTPDDFVRSISPGMMQPEGLGLDRFRVYNPEKIEPTILKGDTIFNKLGERGLLSFSDYVFLLTVLSTSPRNFELAFKMFDINGDGTLDFDEFMQVDAVVRGTTAVGARHRDRVVTGNTLSHKHSALARYLFGPNLDQKLTVGRFLEFQVIYTDLALTLTTQMLQRALHRDTLRVEFERRKDDETSSVISEVQFADMLLMHSGLSDERRKKMKHRVRKAYKSATQPTGIAFDDLEQFFNFVQHINDIDTALSFYHFAGASIDKATLHHVAATIAHCTLSEHVVDVVFTLFDENGDGELSNKEFVAVMKRRLSRGLERPKDTGFLRLLTAAWECAWRNDAPAYF